ESHNEKGVPIANVKENVMVRFVLKRGAERLLFSPMFTAVRDKSASLKHRDVCNEKLAGLISSIYGGVLPTNSSDAYVAGYLGLKHEARGDFSVAVGKSNHTLVLFLALVDRIEVFGMTPPGTDAVNSTASPPETLPPPSNQPSQCGEQDE